MDYIYDIVLNFQNKYYEFFEWKLTDKIINIKKILVYKINNNDYLDLKYNEIIIDKKILPPKTKMILVTNEIEVMGLMIDKEGKIIKRSSLLFEEADEVLENKDLIKELKLTYKQNIPKSHLSYSRVITEKINYLQKYFKNIDIEKDKYLLKFIYYDIYQEEENNIQKIYKKLQTLIKDDLNQIYESIKKINIELKK